MDIIWVPDWQKAMEHLADPEWENTILEAQNQLTTQLADKWPDKFQEWNRLVRESKQRLEQNIFPIFRDFQQANALPQKFIDSVQWDVLGIVMTETYRFCHPPPFSRDLMRIYERGRFPCGWKGEWPNGKLMVI